MSMWLAILTTTILVASHTTSAYKGIIPADPENPKVCIYRGDILSPGVTNAISPCESLTCNDDGSILIVGCGKANFENCNRGERVNLGKPFPECCKLVYKCKKPDGTPHYIEHDAANGTTKKVNPPA